MSTEEFKASTPMRQFDLLNQWEENLFKGMERKYRGGWDQFEKDFGGSFQYMVERKKDLYNLTQKGMSEYRDAAKSSFLEPDPERPWGEAFIASSAVALNQGLGFWLKAAGFDEAGEALIGKGNLVKRAYKQAANRLAEKALDAEKQGLSIGDELVRFGESFLGSILTPDDKNMRYVMPFKMPYKLNYALSVGISDALNAKTSERTWGRFGAVTGSTYGALMFGDVLTKWAAKNPMFVNMVSRMPARAQSFAMGRIADIGESIADSVSYAIRTKNPWDAIKSFPVALAENWVEEMIVDLPGLIGPSKVLAQGQLFQLRKMSDSIGNDIVNLQAAGGNPKRVTRLQSIKQTVDRKYIQRSKQMREYVNRHPREMNRITQTYPDAYNNLVKSKTQEGYTQEEARSEAVGDLAMSEITDITDIDRHAGFNALRLANNAIKRVVKGRPEEVPERDMDFYDRWLSDKDESDAISWARAMTRRDDLAQSVGERPGKKKPGIATDFLKAFTGGQFSRKAQESNEAIKFHISMMNVQNEKGESFQEQWIKNESEIKKNFPKQYDRYKMLVEKAGNLSTEEQRVANDIIKAGRGLGELALSEDIINNF
ncbi:MAG: hypothetical protein ACXADX_21295, partial [Candidatus Hodarchaeales archaeon]